VTHHLALLHLLLLGQVLLKNAVEVILEERIAVLGTVLELEQRLSELQLLCLSEDKGRKVAED
jgi:hypothetical protein